MNAGNVHVSYSALINVTDTPSLIATQDPFSCLNACDLTRQFTILRQDTSYCATAVPTAAADRTSWSSG
jgi:hypothetical protein